VSASLCLCLCSLNRFPFVLQPKQVYELIPDEEDLNRIIVAVPYRRFPAPTLSTLLSRVLRPPANTFVPASASAPVTSVAAAASLSTVNAADGTPFDPTKHLYSFHPEMNLHRLLASTHVLSAERSATVVAEPKLLVSSLPAN
jgi:hypothetical protein